MRLTVQPSYQSFEIEFGSNLLNALQSLSVPISHSCESGRCGTCGLKIIKGAYYESSPDSRRPFASPELNQRVLACQTTLLSDCVVELPELDDAIVHSPKVVKGQLVAINQLSESVVRMSVRLSKPFTFSPGQYTNVTFSNGETRPYSPIGEIEDGIIDYIIKIHRQGRVGRYLEKQVEVGDQVIVSGPFGSCFLKENLDAPIIFIASDTGLAPVLAMMQGALAKPDNDHPIVLIFSVASNRDLFLFEWLKDFANKNDRLTFIPLVTSGPLQSGCERGLITDLINDRFEDLQNWHAYIAGTVTMVEWVSQFVVRKGIHPNHLYSEAFYAVND